MRVRTALLLVVVGMLMSAMVTPASAAEPALVTWAADLSAGEAAGVIVHHGGVELDPQWAPAAQREDLANGPDTIVRSTGLLTLDPHELVSPTVRVDSDVVAELPPGSTATVDVRARRVDGRWTEWIPAIPAKSSTSAGSVTVLLPEPSTEVQGRLVLTGRPGAGPRVHEVQLTAYLLRDATAGAEGTEQRPAEHYRVFATREGLVGATTANGHVITERDHFVALPSRRALSSRGTSDYSVKLCAPGGRCAFAPVWDVGPWNIHDDYWNPATVREQWADLRQGLPEAQAAFRTDYHSGADQFGRRLRNPAGIDLADGVFRDALGLTDNSWVSVDYLWTGSLPLAKVSAASGAVEVRAAPRRDAEVVGLASDSAGVPVQCTLDSGPDRWLRVGEDQFIPAAAVPGAGPGTACAGPG